MFLLMTLKCHLNCSLLQRLCSLHFWCVPASKTPPPPPNQEQTGCFLIYAKRNRNFLVHLECNSAHFPESLVLTGKRVLEQSAMMEGRQSGGGGAIVKAAAKSLRDGWRAGRNWSLHFSFCGHEIFKVQTEPACDTVTRGGRGEGGAL